jgi:uncharacterized ion transporter superfamily protein YfcC
LKLNIGGFAFPLEPIAGNQDALPGFMLKISFPTAHTVLLAIAAIVALMTWLIPAGKYQALKYDAEQSVFIHQRSDTQSVTLPASQATLDQLGIKTEIQKFTNGDIKKPVGIPGTYYRLESKPQGFLAWVQSPLKGIGAAFDVILFVLILGGFIGLLQALGAFDAGIGWLAQRLKGRERLLIYVITAAIALGGTTFGLAEETIGFYPILVPIFLVAGYDAITALACIYIGSSIGTMISTVNPFSVIIASNAAGINWTSGQMSRIAFLVLGTGICIWYILRYAEKVRKNPEHSLVFKQKAAIEAMFLRKEGSQTVALDGRIRLALIIALLCFVVMIVGVSRLNWWFMEMTTVFFIGSLLLFAVSKIKEKDFVEAFIRGANDLLSVALIIGVARGVTIIMEEGCISDTLLYYASNLVEGMPKGLFIVAMMGIFGVLSFFVPSSSGLAVLSMPIMAPLADVVGAPRDAVVDAYMYGMGLVAFITPTGLILPSLTMVDVTFDRWLKFVLPLLGWMTAVSIVVLLIGVYA